ncbi:hypothetical protein M885DRAFT_521015 [Pelagophyceae sp. CCMP2097]|nr:hypothetical protein M885DRAFT_521015 [Pelagophyceae sp. CCMP2097]
MAKKEGVLLKLEHGALGNKWTAKWFSVDLDGLRTIKYYAGGKKPSSSSKPSKALPLASCALRTTAVGPRKLRAFQLMELASGYVMTIAGETEEDHAGWEAFMTLALAPTSPAAKEPVAAAALSQKMVDAYAREDDDDGDCDVPTALKTMGHAAAAPRPYSVAGGEALSARMAAFAADLDDTDLDDDAPARHAAAPAARPASVPVKSVPVKSPAKAPPPMPGPPLIIKAAARDDAAPAGASRPAMHLAGIASAAERRSSGYDAAAPRPPRVTSGPLTARQEQALALQSVLAGMGESEEEVNNRRGSLNSQPLATERAAFACDGFRVNVRAVEFGMCHCGWKKKEHDADALKAAPEGPGRVRALLSQYEATVRAARDKAREAEGILRERDPAKIAELFARARRRSLAAAATARDDALPEPRFANVATNRRELVIAVRTDMAALKKRNLGPGCLIFRVKHYLVGDDNEEHEDDGHDDHAWVDVEPNWDDLRLPTARLAAVTQPGRYCFTAQVMRIQDPGEPVDVVDSMIGTAYFTLEEPAFLQHEAHVHELSALTFGELDAPPYADFDEVTCGHCGVDLRAADTPQTEPRTCAGYGCAEAHVECIFALCLACALPVDGESGSPLASIAVDVGAKRLWLSHPIQFVGNDVGVADKSEALLRQLGVALKRHPGIFARLEGHTNSKCDLNCVGGESHCTNGTCFKNFGQSGGAVGFSRRRAGSVRDRLVAHGIAAERIEAAGLAGSRLVVEDTQGPENFKNRRVEVHCSAESFDF